jgi:D-cysteine desulfhydrase
LLGGSKTRKLDYLLAEARWQQATTWQTVGAIGSAQLVLCAAAADRLGHRLDAHTFWMPPDDLIVERLAAAVSLGAELTYHRNRTTLALRQPRLLMAPPLGHRHVIPPGTTSAMANLGMVRGGLELAHQVDEGALPRPSAVYVALGSGGTAVGLAVGLGLAGLHIAVRAVATVERPFTSRRRIKSMEQAVVDSLRCAGISGPASWSPAPLVVVRDQLGRGYGHATAASLEAVDRCRSFGIALDPIYTGKAMAALLAESRNSPGATALMWHTGLGQLAPPTPGWRERLPRALANRLRQTAMAIE